MRTPYQLEDQPAPQAPAYPLAALSLVEYADKGGWTRALYFARTGEQPPPYDPARPIKRWADNSLAAIIARDPSWIVQYTYYDQTAGAATMRTLKITAAEASTFNLPGVYTYPKYEIAPTAAVVVQMDGTTQTFDPKYLCTKEEAEKFQTEMRLLDPGRTGELRDNELAPGGPQYRWPSDEKRRPWVLRWGADDLQVSIYVQQRNARGIGSPGHWQLVQAGPVWISYVPVTGAMDPRPEVPLPARSLRNTEEIRCTPFGCAVWTTPAPAEGGGGLNAAQAAQLDELHARAADLAPIIEATHAAAMVAVSRLGTLLDHIITPKPEPETASPAAAAPQAAPKPPEKAPEPKTASPAAAAPQAAPKPPEQGKEKK